MKEFNLAKWRQFIIEEASVADGNFGNDIEDRYAYIRPLMSRLPDTARTETLIDFMEDGLREDDKEMFDYGFIEAMKMLGLEDQLMDDGEMEDPGIEDLMPDPALGPNPSFVEEAEGEETDYMKRRRKMSDYYVDNEADEIDIEDLEAAADFFDNLDENDGVLDEMIGELEGEVQTESLEGHLLNFQIQAQKIAKQVGTKRPKLVPGRFDSYTMVFPYDQAPGGAMASVGGVETMSAQEEAAAENRANAAALRFIEFLRADGSPVDQGALGVDYAPGRFMVFLAPL
tara:strand:- start:259 stop:1116 length:858 start_codon:yes stop_codon:yes gene_type:complete